MAPRSRWRELFLQPDAPRSDALQPDARVSLDKPSPEQLHGMSRADRRRAKVAYQAQAGGAFRTWVYVAVLVLLVGGFTAYLLLVS